MRKRIPFVLIMFLVLGTFCSAQSFTSLTFTGKSSITNEHIPLHHVVIDNVTQHWEEILFYPDTVLVFGGWTGIEENEGQTVVRLLQNVPNPFDGVTDFQLELPKGSQVAIEIYGMNGQRISAFSGNLEAGTHLFRATLSSPQTYLASARTENGRVSIKMINNGAGEENRLEHLGCVPTRGDLIFPVSDTKGNTPLPFMLGDEMRYVGYVYRDEIEYASQPIQQQEWGSNAMTLLFGAYRPSVQTDAVSNLTAFTATCGGNVTADGGANVTARGVCWNTSQNPTTADSHTTDGSGTGSFTSSITGLFPNTTYYVRAYATNSVGTIYGNQQTFSTEVNPDGQPCPGTPTLTDIDGNTYNTVRIGEQCWMKENLRTQKYADGTSISQSLDVSETTAYWNYPNNSASNQSTYGLLYNWKAVMRNSSSSDSNPSGVQGICPTGWHVPSDAEWNQLTNYVSSQNAYCCSGNTGNIAKALAATTGWNSYTGSDSGKECYPGYQQAGNNATGFSALPAGGYHGNFYYFGYYAFFWSSTENISGSSAYNRYLVYDDTGVYRTHDIKTYGSSVRCVRNEDVNTPTVTTNSVSNINANSATCGGNVTADGGATVTARGVCWSSTLHNPTIIGSHTTDGSGTGSFTSSITGLSEGTTYYVRAYATNSAGTSYGAQKSFTTAAALPTVTTNSVSNITAFTATCGGNVTAAGIANVTARGICWSTSQNPTVSGCHTTDGSGTGSFTSSITGLTANTTYYVRAYATNSAGTAYGEQRSFTTAAAGNLNDGQPCPGTPTLTDVDGNTYNTVQIGEQCWMKENLRTTKYADNTPIALGSSASTATAYRYYPNNNSGSVFTYGYLYNWKAVMRNSSSSSSNPSGVQGICPTGWHVPSDNEWKQMEMEAGMSQSDAGSAGWRGNIAAKLSGNTGWNSSSTANAAGNLNAPDRNSTGFSALPAGYYGSSYNDFGNTAYFWSATQVVGLGAYVRDLYFHYAGVYRHHDPMSFGYSVRCVRDEVVILLTVTTNSVSNINANSATCGGNVTANGGATVTARGVCWSTSQNPTVSGSHTTNGTGTGPFTSSITGLTANTTYYVRAYATNSAGTAYGEQRSFTTATATLPTVTTNSVSNITEATATCGGNVTADGGATVTARGVCWSTSQNPTVSGGHTTDGSGTGSFTSSITGLTAGTTYYVRAYATNSAGTAYGEQRSFTTAALPTVTTNSVSNITEVTATCGGNVTANGGATVTARGVCWSTSQNPTVSGSHTTDGSGTGGFTSSITGLTANTTYYVRAYATNSAGTAYGQQRSFTTTSSSFYCGTSTVSDIDGNTYNTVKIGSQCWMKENLRTTKKPNGTSISSGIWAPGSNSVTTYGRLYSWSTVMNGASSSNSNPSGVQGICPTGWHVPSDAEWSQLTAYVSSQSEYCCNGNTSNNAKALASTSGWTSYTGSASDKECYPGYQQGNNNSTGFGALPAGRYTSSYNGFGYYAYFWSATEGSSTDAYYHGLAYSNAGVPRNLGNKTYGYSVRCVRDEEDSPTDGQPCPGVPTLTDADGNTYNTVQIGEQCWMKENLRTTKYADGSSISQGDSASYDVGYWYYPDDNSSNKATYGLFYNWKAVMRNSSSSSSNPSGVQGICPDGWHVPSDAEWNQLTAYVSSQSEYCCNGHTSDIAKALAGTTGWASYTGSASDKECYPGYQQGSNNSTSFSALPAGYYDSSYGNFGDYAYFWSATEHSSVDAYYRYLGYNYARVYHDAYVKSYGSSVRCVRDESVAPDSAALPTVTTNSVSNITEATATCGGNVTADGGATVTARGVCWSTSQNPTVSGGHTTDGSGTGSFTSSITGLTANTTYYVRAYATNSAGSSYGAQKSFTTAAAGNLNDGQPCPGVPTLTDADGNTYNTVQIGEQCWMKENLRTTKYADGSSISQGDSASYDVGYWYYPDNDPSNKATYGLLYNWKAVKLTSSSISAPNNVRGICPTGWHVPSDAEWSQLTAYVSSQSEYCCNENTSNIAKALASTSGWTSYTGSGSGKECYPGYQQGSNNSTGFSALPAGNYNSSYGDFGGYAYFWSATDNSSNTAYYRTLYYGYAGVGRYNHFKSNGYSVRCVRDAGIGGGDEPTPCAPTSSTHNIVISLSDLPYTFGTDTTFLAGTTAGTYTLHRTNAGGCDSTITINLTVNAIPTDITDTIAFVPNGGIGAPDTTLVERGEEVTVPTNTYTHDGNWQFAGWNTEANGSGTPYAANATFIANGNITLFAQWNTWCDGTPQANELGTSRIDSVKDHEDNWYKVVQIGNQCWLKENLRTSTNGAGTGNIYTPTTTGYDVETYGRLYDWDAVMQGGLSSTAAPSGVQGICPDGWHVPSDNEWKQMEMAAGMSQSDADAILWRGNIAAKLCGNTGWNSLTTANAAGNLNAPDRNSTGFSALPAGSYNGSYPNVGNYACFWSATERFGETAYNRYLGYNYAGVHRDNLAKARGGSVRCVRDAGDSTTATLPTVTTSAVSNITEATATCGGNVTADGGATVTARGVCWSTSQNPTISGSHTIDGSGTGSFTSSITGLAAGTTYYVRAYATNSVGTSYGEEKQFRTWQSCGTVTDIDGNTYSTVQIGEQCWMKENLRTTKYADGSSISQGDSASYDVGYWYYPDDNSSNKATYGLFYNWKAVMRNSSSSSSNPSGVQGICPDGWHVPSDNEWKQMEMAVGMSQSDAENTGWRGNIAAKLCGNTGWYSSSNANAAGNLNAPDRNSTGFSALPAGNYIGSYYGFGNSAFFWSATECNGGNAYGRYLSYGSAGVYRYIVTKTRGFSVRCVRGQGCNPVYGETSAAACGSYTWHGTTYTESGDYTWTGQTSNGCDSIVTLHLTINNPTHVATTVTECESYVWNGTTYTQSGNYTFSHTDANGCTQVDTLHLTIHPMPNVQISGNSSVNYGESVTLTASGADSYHWNTGANTASVTVAPTTATTYSVTGTTAAGCTGTASKTVTVNYLAPTVTTNSVSNINANSATCGGNVISDGGATVTARGICWSTSQNPTINGSYTTDGSGTGSFTSSITGLTANTTYYVRAYATNSAGTSYGAQKSFTTAAAGNLNDGQPCPGVPTLTDADGNTYNTVQIGEQCWMKENLRTTKKPNGTAISSGIWTPGSNSVTTYGRLYSWSTVMNGASSSNSNPSGVQGICPDGWHVPSDAEWSQLTDYVSSQSEYCCNENTSNIAKALAGTTGWASYTGSASDKECYPGYQQGNNNSIGFSALPAGNHINGHGSFGNLASFWSATEYSSDNSYGRYLKYNYADVTCFTANKSWGFPVRCVRDAGDSPTGGQPCPGVPTLTDADGNTYNTVQIGEQCWMRENLRTDVPGNNGYPNGDANNWEYGRLYSWDVMMNGASSSNSNPSGVQGICPDGWHVPSDNEWKQMEMAVGMSQSDADLSDQFRGNIAAKLSGNTGWNSSTNANAAGNLNAPDRNSTGFSALPAGGYYYSYYSFGNHAHFWSATQFDGTTAYLRDLYYCIAGVSRYGYDQTNGCSVRCVHGQGCNPVYGETSAAACGSYTWHGQTYTESGDYTWTGQTANGCDSIVTLHLTINNPTHVATTVTECESYVWNGTTYTQSGNYTFSHTDANGCTQVDTLHLTIHPMPNVQISGSSSVNYGESVTLTASGADSYHWNTGANTASITVAPTTATTYSVTGTTAAGCTGTASKTVTVNYLAPTVATADFSNYNYTSVTSGGEVTSDGGANVTARGVCWSTSQNPTISGSHTIDGSGTGSFTSSITGLAAGTTYYVRAYATNSVGTAYGEEVSFTTSCNNVEVTITVSDNDTVICDGGQFTLTANATYDEGLGEATYTWTRNGEEIADAHGATLTESPVTVDNDTTTYTYTVVATLTASGCQSVVTDSSTITVTVLPNPTVVIAGDPVICEDNTVALTANVTNEYAGAELTYIWKLDNVTITDGDANDTTLTLILEPRDHAYNFAVVVANEHGCTHRTADFPVIVNPRPVVDSVILSFYEMCYGGQPTITAYAHGGVDTTEDPYIYTWYRNGELIEGVTGATFTDNTREFAVDDEDTYYVYTAVVHQTTSGCTSLPTSSDSLNVYMNPRVEITGNPYICETDPIVCIANVDTSSINVGSLHYTWYEFGQLRDNLAYSYGDSRYFSEYFNARPNPYLIYVEVTRDRGCRTMSEPFEVYVHEKPVVEVTANETDICVGGSVTMTANLENYHMEDLTYQWYTGQVDLAHEIYGATQATYTTPALDATTHYFVRVYRTLSECFDIDDIVINVHADPIITDITVNNAVVCDGGQVVVTANATLEEVLGEATYTWYKNGVEMEGITSNTFIDNPVVVDNDVTEITYSAIVTLAASGCTSEEVAAPVVTVNPHATVSVVTDGSLTVCNGGNVTMTANVDPANDTYTYQWYLDNEQVGYDTNVYIAEGLAARETPYMVHVVVEIAPGCITSTIDQAVAVNVHTMPVLTISGDTTICAGQSTTLTASGADSYIWSTGETTASITVAPTATTTYSVTGTTAAGCTGTASKTVTVNYLAPTVTTADFSNYNYTSVTSGGEVISDGGATVTARGVCWSTSPNPTTAGSHTTDGGGTGSFTSNIADLSEGTTYYVRAYATNSVGTNYGEEKQFRTWQSCGTVTDIDNNTYSTIQIGEQCWMRENLRTTKKPNGTTISSGIWAPGSNSVTTYGRLYSWTTVMNGASSSNSNPSGVQGICPDGWHVPSDNEWKQMEMAAGMSQSDADLSGQYRGNIAAKLCGNTGWNSSTNANAAGNLNAPDRNSTGLSALPAGVYYSSYGSFGRSAVFWSATETSSVSAYHRYLIYNNAGVLRYNENKAVGFSVRCVRGQGCNPVYGETSATACGSYTWHGTTYTQSGDYTWTGQTANGCDSIVTLHLTINNPTHVATTVTECESYVWNGTTYTQSGNYTFSHTDANGCTQVDTLHLTIHESVETTEDLTICESDLPYTYYDTVFEVGTPQFSTFNFQFSTSNGCDSIVTLHLSINQPTSETLNVTVTENSLPYHLNGYTYNAAGSYTQHLTNAAGCDSTLTLNLTVLNNVSVSVDSTICDNDLPLVWNGMTFNNAGSQSVTLTSANNTDSVVLMTLHVNASAYANEEVTLCESQLPFTWHGQTYTQSGDYTWTGQTANGCDSVVTLHLIIFSQPNINIEGLTDVCVGGQVTLTANVQNADGVSTYLWYRDSIDIYVSPEPTYTTEADLPVGSYLYSVEVANNICFSTASIVVTVYPAPEIEGISSSLQPSNQMCEGGTVDLRAPAIIHFDAADIQWHWFRNGAELYDEQIPTISQTLDILGTYAYMVYVTQSGYDGYIPGCQSAPQHINIDVLPQPVWGPTYITPFYEEQPVVTSMDACQNYGVALHTSILGGVRDDAFIRWICAPEDDPNNWSFIGWPGGPIPVDEISSIYDTFPSLGTYIYWPIYESYSNNNCWPVNEPGLLTLTVHENFYQDIAETACGSYTWHGQTYTQSGDYTWHGTSVYGCDSIVTLHLTIHPMPNVQISGSSSVNYGESVTLTASGADSYHWNTGANTASVTVAPTTATTYSVTGTTAAGCTGTASKTVTVNYLAPTVATADFSNYNYTSVTSGGEVISDGGANITARGVCWSTSQNPTVNGSRTTDGSGTGSFTSNIADLSEGTTYYVRAYATNSVGTNYGEEKQFRTWQSCGTLTDADGNTYSTVQIGEQCWMRENLRTDVPGNNGYPNGDANNWEYGRLYSWDVMMNGASSSNANPSGVQGICPDGWHVPSDNEWKQMEMAAGMSQSDADDFEYRGNIAAKLCGNTGWSSSSIANAAGNLNAPDRNSTGFSALPAGDYDYYEGYYDFGSNADFWSATQHGDLYAYGRALYYGLAEVGRGFYSNKTYGYSVRCVRGRGQGCNPPTVTTAAVSNITANSATCGGNVTAAGIANVTARGVCWSTSQNPTVSGSHTTDGSGTGSFTSSITGLTANTTYYVRAYATNSVGTSYGVEKRFRTWQSCGTVTDIDNNTYSTVQIGEQCWMKENLRTTKKPNGTSISSGIWAPGSNSVTTYGRLYSWATVMNGASSSDATPSGVQGICPDGWHVPSDNEWKQMEMVAGMSQSDADNTDYRGNIAAKLCGDAGWWSTDIANAAGNLNAPDRNSTGFSALPAGDYNGRYDDFRDFASFWSATDSSSDDAYFRSLDFLDAGVYRDTANKFWGFSVRCVRDEEDSPTATLPTVITSAVSNITETTATCGGNVTSDGGATITARGVCWSTSPTPTISGSHTTDGSGTGSFTSNIADLSEGTTYYVRAYATNSVGTSYGEEKQFRTWQSCGTVTDIDNNTYSTIQIGEQCWMKENLRTTKYADGTSIPYGDATSYTTGHWYYPNNEEVNKETYGLLYNWKAVMRNSSSSNANPSGVQGICPDGWHVPSDAEWSQLTDYVSSQSEYCCNGHTSDIAKALAGTTGWASYTGSASDKECYPGYQQGNNNSIGFSALPAGGYFGSYYIFGDDAYFWSATENSSDFAYRRSLYYNLAGVNRNYLSKTRGYSVRCVRDEEDSPTDGQPCPGVPTLTDADGNTYNTVQIGEQCWMKENLRTTKYADGSSISQGDSASYDVGYWYYPDDNSSNKATYGLLYNWKAVMRNSSSSSSNPSGVQGICPDGWHVPSDAEWKQLEMAAGMSQSDANNTGFRGNIAAKLCGNTGWISSTTANAAGNLNAPDRNSTGFSALPAGLYISSYYDFGYGATFWSATESSSDGAYYRYLYYTFAGVGRDAAAGSCGTSVRCVRDPFTCGTSTVTDIDGNTYNTVQIGEQCWMRENLRTTKYADGTTISSGIWAPGSNSVTTYGRLYSWATVMNGASSSNSNPSGVQGICPDGWHVPSDNEWKQMEMAVGMSQSDADNTGYRGNVAAKLCGNTGWNLSTNANAAGNLSAPDRNSTGFSALPAGNYNGSYGGFGGDAFFWSATQYADTTAYSRYLSYRNAGVSRNYGYKTSGYSVRCVRD